MCCATSRHWLLETVVALLVETLSLKMNCSVVHCLSFVVALCCRAITLWISFIWFRFCDPERVEEIWMKKKFLGSWNGFVWRFALVSRNISRTFLIVSHCASVSLSFINLLRPLEHEAGVVLAGHHGGHHCGRGDDTRQLLQVNLQWFAEQSVACVGSVGLFHRWWASSHMIGWCITRYWQSLMTGLGHVWEWRHPGLVQRTGAAGVVEVVIESQVWRGVVWFPF